MSATDTTILPIHYRVERCFHDELTQRVPAMTWFKSQDNPFGEPPYGCIQADEAKETTPESGVFYVALAVLVTHPLDVEASTTHGERVQEVRQALNAIPRQGEDTVNGLRVHGFLVQRVTSSNTELEQGTLFELQVGCSLLERGEQPTVTDVPLV